ncbi:MAG: FAD-dependent monooxygenase, partial [Ilumatobacteraceae bacterium]
MHVLIVGGGPVGLVTSLALSSLGVRNTVIERSVDVYGLPRAIVMDAEVRHSLSRLGLGSRLDEVLEPMLAADFVDAAGGHLTGIDLTGIQLLGCPAVSKHFQPMLEAMLRHEVRERGARLMLGSEVREHRADASGVEIRFDDASSVQGDYLVACDGASSRTRKAVGIQLEDLGFDQDWLVVDVELFDRQQAQLPDLTRQVCDPRRPTTLVSGFRNFYRFEFQLQPGENPAEMSSVPQVWKLLSSWISVSQARLVRTATYRFHAVVADRLREGRVLLAGDSAHQMPPFMGQGLNSGMR